MSHEANDLIYEGMLELIEEGVIPLEDAVEMMQRDPDEARAFIARHQEDEDIDNE